MLEGLLYAYSERFHENFPMMIIKDMDEDEIIRTVQSCLQENKPLYVDCPDGVDY